MISVIIPIYNTAKFLSTCIKSIINQTYQDLEIILVMMLQRITLSISVIHLGKKITVLSL